MIAYLKGDVILKNLNSAVLNVSGVGYKVFASEKTISTLQTGKEVELFIYHHLKEDASDLYAFKKQSDMEIFTLLLGVSGVGPKSALSTLNSSSSDEIVQAVISENSDLLTKVSGIGKKTAQRIVLELKGKMSSLPLASLNENGGQVSSNDEIDALMALGYSLYEARTVLSSVPSDITDSAKRVKWALKNIKKG